MTALEIDELIETYEIALRQEFLAAGNYHEAQAATEYERCRCLITAYESGLIDGKNEPMRKMQETVFLDAQNSMYWLELYELKMRYAFNLAESSRKALEARISLTKASLYAQAGMAGMR